MLMKPVLLSLVTITLFITGCKKNEIEVPVFVNQQITMKSFDKKTFELNVDTKQGYVTLNIENMPELVMHDDVSPATGTTPFNTNLSLSSQNAGAGKYTIRVVSYKDGLTDSFRITPVDLTIEPLSNDECSTFFNTIANGNNSSTFVQDADETRGFKEQPSVVFNNGQLALNNLVVYYLITPNYTVSKASAPGQEIPFTVECGNEKITIQETTVLDVDGKSYTLSGSGTINYKTQSYVITYTSGGQTMLLKGSIDYNAYFTQ